MKHALLGVVALFGVGAQSPLPPANVDDARLLECDGTAGTAWRGPGGQYVTAHHVSARGRCSIGGVPVSVFHYNAEQDFAMLTGPVPAEREYRIDCRGIRVGELYRAVGYAGGIDLLALRLSATGVLGAQEGEPQYRTFHRMTGGIPRGMSGSPIISREGRVVAIAVASNSYTSMARPLSDTQLCRGGI